VPLRDLRGKKSFFIAILLTFVYHTIKGKHQRTQSFLESPDFHAAPTYLAEFVMSAAE